MSELTKSKFDSLSPEEQAILMKIGVVIKPDCAERPVPAEKIVQAYITLVETTCRLCHNVDVAAFSMEQVGTALISRQITLLEITSESEVRPRKESTKVCGSCRQNLTLLSRESLIELTIKAAKGMLYDQK
jgi:hypothetical protein